MSKFFSALQAISFRQKVIYISVFLILAVVVLSGITLLNTLSLNSMFSEYRQVAQQNMALSNIQRGMQTINTNVQEYRVAPNDETVSEIKKEVEELEADVVYLLELSDDENIQGQIVILKEEVVRYVDSFYKAVDVQANIDDLQDEFEVLEVSVRQDITTLNHELPQHPNPAALVYGADLMQNLLLARIYGARFISYGLHEDSERAKVEFGYAKNEVSKILALNEGYTGGSGVLEKVDADLRRLAQVFEEIVPFIEVRNIVFSEKIDLIAPEIRKEIRELAGDFQDIQKELGPEMGEGFDSILSQTVMVALFTVIIGVALVVFLIRSIIAMSNKIRMKINDMNKAFSVATDELSHMAQELISAVNNTTERCTIMASASEESSTNVQTVASASEELSAAIADVSQNIQRAASQSRMTAEEANNTQSQLDELQAAISAVDEIILSINNVAEQTNLLALNATIEAARAGDAGKGFAVVANEVKALADETKLMTDNITEQIKKVNLSSAQAIEATRRIIKQIESIDTVTKDVAASVEEQSSATKEISQNAQEAHTGTDSVTQNIIQIQSANEQTDSVAQGLRKSADTIRSRSEEMNASLRAFLKELNKDAA